MKLLLKCVVVSTLSWTAGKIHFTIITHIAFNSYSVYGFLVTLASLHVYGYNFRARLQFNIVMSVAGGTPASGVLFASAVVMSFGIAV